MKACAKPLPLLDRECLVRRRERVLVSGRASKADVWISRLDGGAPVVVKEFAARRGLAGLWGRIQNRREVKLLERLAGDPCVPRLCGSLDPGPGLVVEYVGGKPLWRTLHPRRRAEKLEALQAAVTRLARRGVYHLDLRGRDNVHLASDGQVFLLDWAGAVAFRPGGLAHRLFGGGLERLNDSSLFKWRQLLTPQTVIQERRLSASNAWRWLWPFNRKGVGRDLGLDS